MRNLDLICCRLTVGGRSRAIGLGARAAFVCAIAAVALLAAPGPGWAADQDTATGTPGSANYRIGSGDVLNIEVVGRRDLSQQYTVGQDGVLFMPLTGGPVSTTRSTGSSRATS